MKERERKKERNTRHKNCLTDDRQEFCSRINFETETETGTVKLGTD